MPRNRTAVTGRSQRPALVLGAILALACPSAAQTVSASGAYSVEAMVRADEVAGAQNPLGFGVPPR